MSSNETKQSSMYHIDIDEDEDKDRDTSLSSSATVLSNIFTTCDDDQEQSSKASDFNEDEVSPPVTPSVRFQEDSTPGSDGCSPLKTPEKKSCK
jgi:hypothetical protein